MSYLLHRVPYKRLLLYQSEKQNQNYKCLILRGVLYNCLWLSVLSILQWLSFPLSSD